MTRIVLATKIAAVIVARLQTITTDNGYSLTLTKVLADGRAAVWEPQSIDDLPYLKLFSQSDSPVSSGMAHRISQDRRRSYQIEFRTLVPADGDYSDLLDAAQVDIMAALAANKLTGDGVDEFDIRELNLDITSFDHPDNTGATTAGFVGDLSFVYTQNL